jgi:hypothetical protein
MEKFDSQTVQLVIVAVVAVTMLLQSIVLLAILTTLRKAVQSMRQDIEDLRASVVPVVDYVRELLVQTGPKIEATVTDLAAVKPPTSRWREMKSSSGSKSRASAWTPCSAASWTPSIAQPAS